MEQLTGRGTVVLIPPDAGKRQGTRPGWDGGLYTFTRRVLATDRGGGSRQTRGHDQPIFADIHCDSRPAAHRGRCIWRIERLLAPGGHEQRGPRSAGRAAAGVADQPTGMSTGVTGRSMPLTFTPGRTVLVNTCGAKPVNAPAGQ